MKVKTGWAVTAVTVILITGFIIRTVNFEKSFLFNHDQDLYSWIAKNILVDHHQRLVGQVTSVDGVFIGSFYYYLIAVSHWLLGLNPLAAYLPITMLGIFDIWSIFWVTKRHFGIRPGLVAGIIYAASYGVASFERWSVPTQPTMAWAIWYFELILELLKGNIKWLPLYSLLVAFIWQIHIALLPLIPLPLVALFLSKSNKLKINSKEIKIILLSILCFIIASSPFWIFEIKQNFLQTKALITATKKETGTPSGKMKVYKVIDASGRELQQRLLFGYEIKNVGWYWVIFLIMTVLLIKEKHISRKIFLLIWLWYGLILSIQFVSKRVVSEYYFTNLVPIYIIVCSVFLAKYFKEITLSIIILFYVLINGYWLIIKSDDDRSLYYKNKVIDYIKNDAKSKNYPCIAINYIADPGVGVGFRYLFWEKGVEVIKNTSPEIPVYNIIIPWQISMDEKPIHFGRYGILTPVNNIVKISKEMCNNPDNRLDPLLGYTE